MFNDLRQAGRGLRRSRWYALTAIGVVALGMSLAATAFAVVDGVLFKPLPYRAPQELFSIAGAFSKLPAAPGARARVTTAASIADLEAWSAAVAPATLAAFDLSGAPLPLAGEVRPRVAQVDRRVLEVLGVSPLIGGFRPEHFESRSEIRPVLISYDLWQGHFAGSPSVVGQVAGPPESRVEVVGVMPRGFVFPSASARLIVEVLTPLVASNTVRSDPRSRWLTVIGRIPPNVSVAEIEARLTRAMQQVAATWPPVTLPPNTGETTRITRGPADLALIRPLDDVLTANEAAVSRIVFAAAIFLVLLSTVTVAGLVVSRLEDRRAELTMRRALGGSPGRIIRMIAAENAVAVFAGVALGGLAAVPLLRITLALMPPGLMYLKPPVLDARVVLFCLLASIVIVGLTTLWASRRFTSGSFTVEASARATAGRQAARARSALIAIQVAVALVMAVGGVLLASSLLRVWREDPGFNPDHAATIRLNATPAATHATLRELLATLEGLPGVAAVGGLGEPFLDRAFNGNEFEQPAAARNVDAEGLSVTRGYFDAAGLRAVSGRLPTDEEMDSGARVLVVSELVARGYWPNAPAIGQRLKHDEDGTEFVVIGVVPDARYRSLDRDPDGALYSSLAIQERPTLVNVVVRFDSDAAGRIAPAVDMLSARFPMYRVRSARTVTASLGESIRSRRFQTWLFSAFGLAAVVLTGAGILGVLAMTTARRTREVGIRMAIGATRAAVVAQLLREQMLTVTLGLLIGGGFAVWAARFVRAFLYKLDIYDPLVWAIAVLTIIGTATIGTLIPALRASKVDPVSALRAE
jgi:putative ABC transport system permease protein